MSVYATSSGADDDPYLRHMGGWRIRSASILREALALLCKD